MVDYVSVVTNGKIVDQAITRVLQNDILNTNIIQCATLVIAASDSSAKSKALADYICDGVADDVEIQAALDALPSTGGKIQLCEGSFYFSTVVSRAIDNVLFEGMGASTYLKRNSLDIIISAGTQKRWIFSNFRFDAGGIDTTIATKYEYQNVWKDTNAGNTIYLDHWGDECISPQSAGNLQSVISCHPLINLLDDFENSDWFLASSGTLTFDTNIKYSGTHSAKFVVNTAATFYKAYSLGINLENCSLSVQAYTQDYTAIQSIQIQIMVSSFDYVVFKMSVLPKINNMWYPLVFTHFDVTGSPDLTQATSVRIKIFPQTGKTATVYFDRLCYWKRGLLTPKGAVTFTFDDGFPNINTLGKPIFDRYNYKGIQSYVIGRLTDESISTAKAMQNAGWDIVSHSYNHNVTITKRDYVLEYALSQKWLAENGFQNGSKHALLFGGNYSEALLEYLTNNLELTRGSLVGYNSLPGLSTLVYSQVVFNTTTVDNVKGWIDFAKANGLWLVLMFHDIVTSSPTEYQWLASDLDTVVTYCNTVDTEVLTFSQIVERIKSLNVVSRGSGTITNGATLVNIKHGFAKTPTTIKITPTSSLGSATSIWVSDNDTGTGNLFTVSVNADPGADVTFDWEAVL